MQPGNREHSHLGFHGRQYRVYAEVCFVGRNKELADLCIACARNTRSRVPVVLKGKRVGWAGEWKIRRPYGRLTIEAWLTVSIGIRRLIHDGATAQAIGDKTKRRIVRIVLEE